MKPSVETIARTIALALVLANQIIVMFGGDALPWTQDEMYAGVSAALTVVVSLWTWWKNNSFTLAAIEADEGIKAAKHAKEE